MRLPILRFIIMKKNVCCIISSIIIFLITGCYHYIYDKKMVIEDDKCFFQDTLGIIETNLYPFDISHLDLRALYNRCCKGTIIDTTVLTITEKRCLICSMTNNNSKIEIYRNEYEKGIYDYFVDDYKITSNLFGVKNGIAIGMRKKDFLKKIGVNPLLDCDILLVEVKYRYGYSYRFIFKHQQLESIEKIGRRL